MKWSLLVVALLGAMTYAAIFIAQSQHERGEQKSPVAVAADVPVEQEAVVREEISATNDKVGVSNPANDAEPSFTGDPWPAGVAAFENGDFELAAVALREAVAEKETSSYRHYLLGLTLRRLGEVDEAATELERSLELSPGAVRTAVNLARVRLDLDEVEAAREAVDVALESDLEFADAWQVLGRIELAEGNLQAAEAAFGRAVARDPGHAWAQNNLGYARILQERFDEAVVPLAQAVASGKDEAVFYNNLGVALERSGHPDLACQSFGRAAAIGHGPGEAAYERVAAVLEQNGGTVSTMDEIESLAGEQLALRVEDALAAEALVASMDAVEDFAAVDRGTEEFVEEDAPR